jgi:competence protein ComEA
MRRQAWIRFWSLLAGLTLVVLGPPALDAQQKAKTAESAKINLNTASQQELEKLPGVGEATAKKIIAGRPYSSVADLSKAGVPAATIEKITPQVTVGSASAAAPKAGTEKPAAGTTAKKTEPAKAGGAKVDLNTATEKELEALSGVGPATAKKIIAGRPYASVNDLSKAGLSAKQIEQIGPQVTVGASSAAATPAPSTSAAPAAKPAEPAKAATPAPSPSPSAAAKSTEPAKPTAQAQQPPVKGMVWVNTDSGIFHREGDRWYGKTKSGKFMTEADAVKEGYREAKK